MDAVWLLSIIVTIFVLLAIGKLFSIAAHLKRLVEINEDILGEILDARPSKESPSVTQSR